MRAAIYVRVSTGQQVEGTSLDRQEELCRNKAKELGYSPDQIDLFREEGFSGEDISIRPVMSNLRKLTSERVYSHVICYHPDRFSRDMTDKLIVCREFEKHGVDLAFSDTEYANSPEGKLFFNIMSSIAEYEHGLIKKRTIGGRIGRVKEHKEVMPMRVPPFGYDWKDKQLIINEEEAKYVRMVYQWYVYDKLTLREIGKRLFNYGVQPKRKESNVWNANSIGRIITSEIYNGRYYYNRRKTQKVRGEVTKNGNPKKTYEFRDKDEWLLVEVPMIIDDDLWNLAQKQRAKNKKNGGNVKHKYLLKSLLICKNCGRRWDGTFYSGKPTKKRKEKKIYLMYRCPNKNPKNYDDDKFCNCKNNTIRADILENFIWDQVIVNIIKNPAKMNKQLAQSSKNNKDDVQDKINLLYLNVKKKEEEKGRIKKMFQLGMIEENEMIKGMKSVNDEIRNIEYDISLLESKQKAQSSNEHKKETLMRFSEEYIERIESAEELDFDFKRRLITTFIDEIVIDIDKNNEVDMDIRGVIQSLGEGETNIVSSTHRLDVMNTMRRLEMLVKSRFTIEKMLKGRHYSYIINENSISNEFILR